jgi:hypothetical protein
MSVEKFYNDSGEFFCEYCDTLTDEFISCQKCNSLFCFECIGAYIFYCPFCMNYWDHGSVGSMSPD